MDTIATMSMTNILSVMMLLLLGVMGVTMLVYALVSSLMTE